MVQQQAKRALGKGQGWPKWRGVAGSNRQRRNESITRRLCACRCARSRVWASAHAGTGACGRACGRCLEACARCVATCRQVSSPTQ
eukprot:6176360-Pleurochrysis_carterae.AAC.5